MWGQSLVSYFFFSFRGFRLFGANLLFFSSSYFSHYRKMMLLPTAALAAVMSCWCCFTSIDSAEKGIVQTFGKYSRTAEPGTLIVAVYCQ
jgi:hypothetical protein